MRYLLLAFLVSMIAISEDAQASDQPATAPIPSWVKPVDIPKPSVLSGDAAVQILLQDEQLNVLAGRKTLFSHFVLKIQTPQGLSAGNLHFAWRPDRDTPTVHVLAIRRGDEVIDVLASGQKFAVLRRESNLEYAALDGVLTANIQPEGLQVGDVLDFAISMESSDPELDGNIEQLSALWNAAPALRSHFSMQWPKDQQLRWLQSDSLPKLKAVTKGDVNSLDLVQDNIEPLVMPSGAPQRYQWGRYIQVSSFDSWSDISLLLSPLYAKASKLSENGKLQAEIERIKAISTDPKARAEAALALVQDKVRYVFLGMNDGGLVPADAELSWSRRFGDCKAKTVLLMALLNGLGIASEPVLVNTGSGDGMDQRLPMVALFNHVLVRATINGQTFWLDGTRMGDKRIDATKVPAYFWGLPLTNKGSQLVSMMPPPLTEPREEVNILIDATQGIALPAPTKVERIMRGDSGQAFHQVMANMAPATRDAALKDYWKGQYDFITIKKVTTNFDANKAELRLTMEGDALMDWTSDYYETDGSGLGYQADFSRADSLDHDAPYAVAYPAFSRNVETILLPPSFDLAKHAIPEEVNETIAGTEYRRKFTFIGNEFTVESSERAVANEFPASDAVRAQAELRKLADDTVYLAKPANYVPTPKEVDAALAKPLNSFSGFMERGKLLLENRQLDGALSDFSSALALDGKNIEALASRGMTYVLMSDYSSARKDLEAATAVDPKNPVFQKISGLQQALGLLAEQAGDFNGAIAAFTAALQSDPRNHFALAHRATAYYAVGDYAKALADSETSLNEQPKNIDLYLLRANVFRRQGRDRETLGEAIALAKTMPDNVLARVTAARIYDGVGRKTEAMNEFDAAIAIKPEAIIYINRSAVRNKDDITGRLADIEAAIRLEPNSEDALLVMTELLQDNGDFDGAVENWNRLIQIEPTNSHWLVSRALAFLKLGELELAAKDFTSARTNAKDADSLNALCWSKATAGVELESALENCNAALEKNSASDAILDSRGLVLLRLGRFADAIADYSQALSKNSGLAYSLYGRAIAWLRQGDEEKSNADMTAALKLDPTVKAEFKKFGISLP